MDRGENHLRRREARAALGRAGAYGVLALLLAAALGLEGCGEGTFKFNLISAQQLGEKTYLLVNTTEALQLAGPGEDTFGIFELAATDGSRFVPVVERRRGPVLGTFTFTEPGAQRLGIFHPRGVSLFKFPGGPEGKVEDAFQPLDLTWVPETGAQLGSELFIFGCPAPPFEEGARKPKDVPIQVARYTGRGFETLALEQPPQLRTGPEGMFWIKAVAAGDKIRLFWRAAVFSTQSDVEPLVNLAGPLQTVLFNGRAFEGSPGKIEGLPHGFVDAWYDGREFGLVVQPTDRTLLQTPPPRLYRLGPELALREIPLSHQSRPSKLHITYYNILRLAAQDQDLFLRTNSQDFEVWRPGPGEWLVGTRPEGLPAHNLEQYLWGLVAAAGGMILLGLFLAIRRRHQVRFLLDKLRPKDVMAPVILRVSAHLIDLGLLVLVAEGVALVWPLEGLSPLRSLLMLPAPDLFFFLYLAYLTLMESLLGASVGKLLLGLRVVDPAGARPTFWAALVRNMIGFYERHPVLAPFAALPTILLTPRQQRLGDLLARTLVVQGVALDRFQIQREERQLDEERERHEARNGPTDKESTGGGAGGSAADDPQRPEGADTKGP